MDYKYEAGQTLKLALPIILGELAQMSLHFIDTAMIGAVGYKQLAAASLVLNVINIPFIFGIGITISVAQMVSMAHGRNDKKLVSHYFYNGFVLCLIAALLIGAGLLLTRNVLYHLKQDPEVVAYAIPFMRYMSISIIPMILFMALKQFADGMQYTKTAMALSLAAIPLNAFINWLLIYGNWGFPRLQLVGAGIATLTTRCIIFILLAIVILKHRRFARYIAVAKSQWKMSGAAVRQLLKIGIPSSLQIGMEAGEFALSGIIIGTIDPAPQAAHQIALACASFTFMVSLGLAQAGSIRVSHAYGSGQWKKIYAIGKSTLALSLGYGLLCCVFFILFKNNLPLLFNKEAQVVGIASSLLILAAFFQISDPIQATSAGLLRGIKDVKVPTYIVAIAYWALGIPAGYFLAFQFGMGGMGVWVAFIVGLAFAAIFLTLRFFKTVKKNF